jgi:hypothetical protein
MTTITFPSGRLTAGECGVDGETSLMAAGSLVPPPG